MNPLRRKRSTNGVLGMASLRTPLEPSRLTKALVMITLIILCLPAMLPMVWMVATSLKANDEVFAKNGQGAQMASLRWQNYPDALNAVPYVAYLRNTVFLCLITVIGAVFSSAVVAFGFARHRFVGSSLLFLLMISTMAVPAQVTMIPMFALFKALGWYDTYLPLIVPAFTGAPFFIFLLTQFFRTLPEELAEAARIDGMNEWRIFTRIVLPLSKPALATCALFQFIGTWNDFLGPLLYVNDPNKYTLAYGLQQFMSKNTGAWTLLMAGATIFTIPMLVLFFLAQKTFIQGIATTGGRN